MLWGQFQGRIFMPGCGSGSQYYTAEVTSLQKCVGGGVELVLHGWNIMSCKN